MTAPARGGDVRASPERSTPRWPVVLLVVAGVLVHAGSLRGEFVFDDLSQIVRNPEIRRVWPGMEAFLTRQRTITTLSFALDHAVHGLRPAGYHLLNLAVHLAAGLVLYGIVRRTLALERFAGRHARSGPWIATAAALLWLVHPLQTESVTYVVQRAEAAMGLCYLLALDCTLRAAARPARRVWQLAAVLACALGMGCKPVMVTAPLVILAFDRIFLARSWRELVRARGPLHAGLCLTWLVIGVTGLPRLLLDASESRATVGLGVEGTGTWSYLLTQTEVVLHYLRLALWPQPLVLDYGWPLAASIRDVALPAAAVALLLVATLVALVRRPPAGFLGLWFFVILAPTSSFVPVRDAAFEHRMYLPLAAVLTGLVLLGHALVRTLVARRVLAARPAGTLAAGLAAAAALALGARSIARNRDYQDAVELWRANLEATPENGRAYMLLADALVRRGQHGEALDVLESGVLALTSRTLSPASRTYLSGIHDSRGTILRTLGRWEEAVAQYRRAIELLPESAEAHTNLGTALVAQGEYEAALASLERALALAPDSAEVQNNLAWLLATCPLDALRDGARAVELATRAAVARAFLEASLLDTLAAAHAEVGDFAQAVSWQERAVALASSAQKAALQARLAVYRRREPFRMEREA